LAPRRSVCGALPKICGFSPRESLRVGVGMISRGEVGLIVAGYGLGHGLIGQDVFSASVIIVLVTTIIAPQLLRLVFPAVERRHAAGRKRSRTDRTTCTGRQRRGSPSEPLV